MSGQQVLAVQKLGFPWPMENPFLFCAHHQDSYPRGNKEQGPAVSISDRNLGNDFSRKNGFSMYHGTQVPGFPEHPHRGFETVTVVLDGFVDHFDSKGSEGRYGNGDVQWLTTGSGCQHSELFPLVNEDKENPLGLFQIWLNLPAKDKFAEPAYKMFWAEDIPVVETQNANGSKTTVKVIAGTFQQQESLLPCPNSWASDTKNHVGIYLIQMEAGASIALPSISKTLIRNLYYYQGNGVIEIAGTVIPVSNRVKLPGHDEVVISNGDRESLLILLEGEPIPEPVVQHGPFVMNTEKEIREAFADFHRTRFGGWPWDRPDPVHERSIGRFARHADGRIEMR